MHRSLGPWLVIILTFVGPFQTDAYVESVSAALRGTRVSDSVETELFNGHRFVPRVAFHCGYLNQHTVKNGTWISDRNPLASCLHGKLDILKYCRKMYPGLDITNIAEDVTDVQISNWCSPSGSPCKWTFNVKPYRCIVGEFQSEPLLVPERCHFGHLNDANSCEPAAHWNTTATSECSKKNLNLKSFNILEPCGLDLFSGVEYVCCPTDVSESTVAERKDKVGVGKKQLKTAKPQFEIDSEEDNYDNDDADDFELKTVHIPETSTHKLRTSAEEDLEGDSDELDQEEASLSGSVSRDSYFRTADPAKEHVRFLAAVKRLEKKHEQKVSKVMEEWSDLESRYQDMKKKDQKHAEEFRRDMLKRFQKTVAALEAENREQRRQLDSVHQQRVMTALNERKRVTIQDYRDALELASIAGGDTKAHEVLKTLQAYIRAEEKDRTHTLNHYRHLLKSDTDTAEKEKQAVARRLHDIDLRINGTIDMLRDVPKLEQKIKLVILSFWQNYRKSNEPSDLDELVSSFTAVLQKTTTEIKPEQFATTTLESVHTSRGPLDPLVAREPEYTDNDADTELNARENKKFKSDQSEYADDDDDDDDEYDEKDDVIKVPSSIDLQRNEDSDEVFLSSERPIPTRPNKKKLTSFKADAPTSTETMFAEKKKTQSKGRMLQKVEDFEHVHAAAQQHKQSFHISQFNDEEFESSAVKGASSGTYLAFSFVGFAVMVCAVVGIVLYRQRHHSRAGFIKVDACSQEEKHLAKLQVNGYENPTYTFFEATA